MDSGLRRIAHGEDHKKTAHGIIRDQEKCTPHLNSQTKILRAFSWRSKLIDINRKIFRTLPNLQILKLPHPPLSCAVHRAAPSGPGHSTYADPLRSNRYKAPYQVFINEETHGGGSQEAFQEMNTVSSWAIVSAAKRMAACISSTTSCGYACKRSACVAFSLSLRKISSTGMRVPRITGLPIITLGVCSEFT